MNYDKGSCESEPYIASPWERQKAIKYRQERGYPMRSIDDLVESENTAKALGYGFALASVFSAAVGLVTHMFDLNTATYVAGAVTIITGIPSAGFFGGAKLCRNEIETGNYLSERRNFSKQPNL